MRSTVAMKPASMLISIITRKPGVFRPVTTATRFAENPTRKNTEVANTKLIAISIHASR